MLDFTPLLEAVIALAFTLITAFLIPWLKNKYGTENLNNMNHLLLYMLPIRQEGFQLLHLPPIFICANGRQCRITGV